MKLTKEIADKFQPEGSDVVLTDDEITGFAIRIRNGKRSWIFQYSITVEGKRVNARMSLGQYPGMTCDAARKAAATLRSKVNLGEHPAAQKQTKRQEAVQTFGALVDAYLDDLKTTVRPSTFNDAERYLRVHVSGLHNRPCSMIDVASIQKELDRVRKATGSPTANRLRSTLSAAFAWAIPRGFSKANPVIGTEKNAEVARDRVLSDAELKTVWNALSDDAFSDVVRLLILTGQRLEEIAGLHWSEIDFDAGEIRLPAARVKNKRDHTVPMSAAVRSILVARKGRTDGVLDGVFESARGGIGNYGARMDRLRDAVKLPPWRLHDLRRSVASGMADDDMEILPHVVEAVLNHVSGHRSGVAGTYNRAKYSKLMREALDKWSAHIVELTAGEPSKVIRMRRA